MLLYYSTEKINLQLQHIIDFISNNLFNCMIDAIIFIPRNKYWLHSQSNVSPEALLFKIWAREKMRKDCRRVLKKSHFVENAFPSFSLVLSFSFSHSLSLMSVSRVERRITFEAERAKKIASTRHISIHDERYMPYATMDMLSCVHTMISIYTRTHTYAHACRCIYRDKPAPFRSFDKSGPRSADFLRASP